MTEQNLKSFVLMDDQHEEREDVLDGVDGRVSG